MRWLNLIEEVRKRPFIFEYSVTRSVKVLNDKWKEVANCIGLEEKVCRKEWTRLRSVYCVKTRQKLERIEHEKLLGVYNPNKNYDSSWIYYKHLKFLDGSLAMKNYKQICWNDENDGDENDDGEQDDDEIDDKIEIEDSDNDHLSTSSSNLNTSDALNVGGCDNNSKNEDNACSIDRESCKPLDLQIDINSPFEEPKNTMTPETKISTETENTSSSNELDSLDCKEYLDCPPPQATLNQENESAQQIQSTVKIKKEIEDESYDIGNALSLQNAQFQNIESARIKDEPVDEDQRNQLNLSKTSDATSNKHPSTENSFNLLPKKRPRLSIQNTFMNSQEHNEKLPTAHDVQDLDLKFFLSFLPHMKSLSQFQNLNFRAKVSGLIQTILSSRNFKQIDYAGAYEQQSALVRKYGNTKDPDCNFLVSFLPHVKSLSKAENSQLRVKMSGLMFNM